MRKNTLILFAMVLILPAMLMTVSCAKQAVESTPETTQAPAAPAPAQQPATVQPTAPAPTQGPDEAALRAQELERQRQAAISAFANENVHFEFDSAVLSPEAQQVLSKKADFLNSNNVSVIIEGHCDERGTDAYNLALGERRAEAAKAYLVNLGIGANRLATVSYGEERPLDPGKNETAYAKNRRAQFVIK